MIRACLILLIGLSLFAISGNAAAIPGKGCNPNYGNIDYREPGFSPPDDANFSAPSSDVPVDSNQPNSTGNDPRSGAEIGEYNNQVFPLTADTLTSLEGFQSKYVSNKTVLLLFLSTKEPGKWLCNSVSHKLLTAKIVSYNKEEMEILFYKNIFTVSRTDLRKRHFLQLIGPDYVWKGRIFVLDNEAFTRLKKITSQYSKAFSIANAEKKPDILEAYLAVATRYIRINDANISLEKIAVEKSSIDKGILEKYGIDCARYPDNEICVFSKALQLSEAADPRTAFRTTDALFNNSGISFGLHQIDIGMSPEKKRLTVKYFSSKDMHENDLLQYTIPIRALSHTQLDDLYKKFIPYANSRLSMPDVRKKIIDDYVETLGKLLPTKPDANARLFQSDDVRLLRILQADQANVGGNRIVVDRNATSICDVVNKTPDRRKDGPRHQRWLNIVNEYNAAYGSHISNCEEKISQ